MSNYLATATVTAALGQIVQEEVARAIPDAEVKFGRPVEKESPSSPVVHLYLYMVSPNQGLSNCHLPTQNNDGTLVQDPRLALDLFYIISFYGEDNQLVPQRMMGKTICALLTHPILTRERIKQVVESDQYKYLAESDLALQVESVKFSPVYLSTEDFTKLWSVFLQVPHRLFLTYQATVVLLEPHLSYKEALPVSNPRVLPPPGGIPVIHRVIPGVVQYENKNKDTPPQVEIRGENLWFGPPAAEKNTVVMFSDIPGEVIHHAGTSLTVQLPQDLPAGINSVRVFHHMEKQDTHPNGPGEKRSVGSNKLDFILRPRVEEIEYTPPNRDAGEENGCITVTITPGILAQQQVELFLNQQVETGEETMDYSFPFIPPTSPPQPPVISKFPFKIKEVKPGKYLVRLRIDHQPLAEPPLEADQKTGRYTGPSVEIT